MPGSEVAAFAPGRVNLIGDHTDHTGGLALPMAIQLGTTVRGVRRGTRVALRSADDPAPVDLALDDPFAAAGDHGWGRYVAGVVAELRPATGLVGEVTSTLPIGAGLSSSASLELAVALALGFEGSRRALAELCQRAEQRASGVPCGLMDQLVSAEGLAGRALLIDFTDVTVTPVPVADDVEVVVVHSGEPRALAGSAYAARRAECERAAAVIGPLRDATVDDVDRLEDPVVRRRARHVVTENARVRAFATALADGRYDEAGDLMVASHASLRDDFEVSTPALDALVERLTRTEGVHGARLTGAGFGGCAVALTDPGALQEGWKVKPSAGARLLEA